MGDTEKEVKEEGQNKAKKDVVLIIEGVIALAAVIFIIVVLVLKNKNADSSENTQMLADTSIETVTDMETDNSDYPAKDDLLEISQSECETLVASGDMIKITTSKGIEVYVNNYSDISYLNGQLEVEDKQIDDAIYADFLIQYVKEAPSDKDIAEWYDVVDIDYSGQIDGVVFDGGTATGQSLALGSGQFIPGFEDGVVGMKVGETKDVLTHFPENYGAADLSGKDAIFTVKLNKIVSEGVELTDEIAKENFTDMPTAKAVKDHYKEQAQLEKAASFINERFYVSKLDTQLADGYYAYSIEYYENMAESYGITLDELIGYYGTDTETFTSDMRRSAASAALTSTVFMAIAENEGIELSDALYTKYAEKYGFASKEELVDYFGEVVSKDVVLTESVIENMISSIK